MHCPNCGKELNGSEKFCGGCGNDLTHLVYTSAPVAGSAPVIPAPIVEPASAPVAPVVPVTPVTPVAEVTPEPVVAAPVEPAPAPIPEPIPEPAPVVEPVVEAAPVEPALHLRHPVRDGDSRDFPPLPVPLRFKKFHQKYLVSGAYYARLESICQQEKHVKIRTLPEVTVANCTLPQ